MRIKPNKTSVEGRVASDRAAADGGIGAEIEIEIERTRSAERP